MPVGNVVSELDGLATERNFDENGSVVSHGKFLPSVRNGE
jgi:hypothetical protein